MASTHTLAEKGGRFGRSCLAAALALAFLGPAVAAVPEATVKAVFLFHFTHFVDWPPAAFPGTAAPFVIGVWGADPLEEALPGVIRGEKAGRHPLVLRMVDSAEEAKGCQILYVARGSERRFRGGDFKGRSVLTVGESAYFLHEGGIIAFRTEGGHVRLRVNLAAARDSGVGISATLLRLAEVEERP